MKDFIFVPPCAYVHFPWHTFLFFTVSCFLCLPGFSSFTTSSTLHPPLPLTPVSHLSTLHNVSLSLLFSSVLSRQFDLHFISPAHNLLRYLPYSSQVFTSCHSCWIQRGMVDVPVTFHFTVHHHLLSKICSVCGCICMNTSLLLWGSVEVPLYFHYLPLSSVPEV